MPIELNDRKEVVPRFWGQTYCWCIPGSFSFFSPCERSIPSAVDVKSTITILILAGASLSPHSRSVQCPRRFWDRSYFFAHVLYAPAEPVTNKALSFVLFLPNIYVFLYFFGYLVHMESHHISGEKKKIENGSAGAYKIRVQNDRIYLLKTARTFGPLCGKRAKITAPHRNYLVSV